MEAEDNQIFALDVRGDGATFATAGCDGAVRVYDEATHKLRATLRGQGEGSSRQTLKESGGGGSGGGHTSRVFGLKYARDDENIMISGGWDNTVQMWDERCGDGAVRSMFGPHVCG